MNRTVWLGVLTVAIAGGQELLTRAAQAPGHRLTVIDFGAAALTAGVALRALYQMPPASLKDAP